MEPRAQTIKINSPANASIQPFEVSGAKVGETGRGAREA